MAHLHEVRDTDTHFVIDPITRTITNNSLKTALMRGDHNSEIFTFEIPKLIEAHDMSQCNRVEIHYNNISLVGFFFFCVTLSLSIELLSLGLGVVTLF